MTGQLSEVKLVELDKNKAKIVAKTLEGKVVESEPVERDVAGKSYFIILEYLKWGKEIRR